MSDYLVNQVERLISWISQNPITTIVAIIGAIIAVFFCWKLKQRFYEGGS